MVHRNYHAFLECLNEAHERFSLQVHSYCLMENHYHLLLKTPKGNLERAMRHVNGIYTQRYNRLKKTDGHLFRGRYKAILIDADRYLLEVSRYIHRNPLKTRTPMVTDLANYAWSSYTQFTSKTGKKKQDWLSRDEILGMIGGTKPWKGYQSFVSAGNGHDIKKFYGSKQIPAIMGDKVFKEKALIGVDLSQEFSDGSVREAVTVEKILMVVTDRFDCSHKEVLNVQRRRQPKNYARWIAMKLCQSHWQLSLQSIAEVFEVGHYSTISKTIGRLNQAIGEDKEVAKLLDVMSQNLTL